MSAQSSWILVFFLLFGSFAVDSLCVRGDADLAAREDVDSRVREDEPVNVSAPRAIRAGGRNTKLPRPAVTASNDVLSLLFVSSVAAFASTGKARQFRLFTVLRV
jgi:hypothetical protein